MSYLSGILSKVPGALGDEDNAAYTLIRCKAFDGEWDALVWKIEPFNLPDLDPRMLESPVPWKAVVIFAGTIMSCKEEAERTRDLSEEGV